MLGLHGGHQRRIGGLHTLPDFFQGVCPDAVLQAVFSSKLALCKGSARCIDQNCLNTGGAKLHAEGTGFQVNLRMRVLLYNIPDALLPNTRIYKMPHSGIDLECGTQRISGTPFNFFKYGLTQFCKTSLLREIGRAHV